MAITKEVNPVRSDAEAIAISMQFEAEADAYFAGKGSHQLGRERFYRNRLMKVAGFDYTEALREFRRWVRERSAHHCVEG